MKRRDIQALPAKTIDELRQQLVIVQQQLAKARLELAAGKIEDVRQPAKLSDDIARIKGVIRDKELMAAAQKA